MNDAPAQGGYVLVGDSINPSGAIAANSLRAKLGHQSEMSVKVEGPITAACQKKGCWMTMDMGDETEMLVRFKDYGFFVPVDCAGSTAVIEGVAKVETISVDELRHYAEDEGQTPEQIAQITEPEEKLTFEAFGVALKAPEGH